VCVDAYLCGCVCVHVIVFTVDLCVDSRMQGGRRHTHVRGEKEGTGASNPIKRSP
jgi:hypothetical protein